MRFGRYDLIRRIGEGGMSEVFLARPVGEEDAREIVIKRMRPTLADDERFVELFQEEARIAAMMDHPNVVRVFEAGEVYGQLFIAMEYVDGVDCWRLVNGCVARGAPPSPPVACFVMRQALRGLAHVHEAKDGSGTSMGVVHGDVSPTNVYTSRAGEVKLGDFGIARRKHRELSTGRSQLTGKVAYMAPEQVLGLPFDMAADLFAAGTVLTELLIQDRLFATKSHLTTLLAIRDVRLDAIEPHRHKLPGGMEGYIHRALARDPRERFQSASEMAEALEPFLEGVSDAELEEELATLVALVAPEDEDEGDEGDRPTVIPDGSADELAEPSGEVEQVVELEVGFDDEDERETARPGEDDDEREGRGVDEEKDEHERTTARYKAPPLEIELCSEEEPPSPVEGPDGSDLAISERVTPGSPLPARGDAAAALPPEERPTPAHAVPAVTFPSAQEKKRPPRRSGSISSELELDIDIEEKVRETPVPTPMPSIEDLEAMGHHTPTTPVGPIAQVTFRHADGTTLGPMHFPAALDKVMEGAVGPEDEVSVDGSPFRPLAEVDELMRFAPAPTPTTGRVDAVPPPDRRALLTDEPVARIFARLAVERESGMAVFEHGPIRKDIYFVEGNPNHVSSNMASELLGEHLVRSGVISRMELEMAFALLPKFDNHLGDTLVGLGLIDSVALFRHISDQVRGKLLDLFSWTKGEFRYYRGVKCPQPTFPLGIQALAILWEGLSRSWDEESAEKWLEEQGPKRAREGERPVVPISDVALPESLAGKLAPRDRPEKVAALVRRLAKEAGVSKAEAALLVRLAADLGVLRLSET